MSTTSDDTRPMTTFEVDLLLAKMLDDEWWEWERLRLMAMERDRRVTVSATIGFRFPLVKEE